MEKWIAKLKKARGLIESGWCQTYAAIDSKGESQAAGSKKAVAWCTVGALMRVGLKNSLVTRDLFWSVLPMSAYTRLGDWNDKKGRTKEQVLRLFDRAIKKAEKEMKK